MHSPAARRSHQHAAVATPGSTRSSPAREPIHALPPLVVYATLETRPHGLIQAVQPQARDSRGASAGRAEQRLRGARHHLDAFAQGADTMERQVGEIDALLARLTSTTMPWVIGGDFNLLPSAEARQRLIPSHQSFFNPRTEITPLYAHYQAVPSYTEATGAEDWRRYTYFPYDPAIGHVDRTLDYLFLAPNVWLGRRGVRQDNRQAISDHLPLIAEIQIEQLGATIRLPPARKRTQRGV